MTKGTKTFTIILVLAALGAVAWWYMHRSGESEKSAAGISGGENETQVRPVAHVQVAPVQRKNITQTATAYGSVLAQPGKTRSVTLSYETRVEHVLVAPGQVLAQGDPLVEIEPSAASQLQVQQARSALEAAQKELKQTEQRYKQHLAVNTDLNQAQKALRDAQNQWESLSRQGVGTNNEVHSPLAGIVSKVDVQDGQVAAANSPLLEIVATGDVEVKLGVEPGMIASLNKEEPVIIYPVNNPASNGLDGKVRLITRVVDPTTRLVDVYVSVPPENNLLLNGYVRGEIATSASNVLVAPRQALLPADGGGYIVYSVEGGHARKHIAEAGIQNNTDMELLNSGLHEGDQVVTVGNLELEDGMDTEIVK